MGRLFARNRTSNLPLDHVNRSRELFDSLGWDANEGDSIRGLMFDRFVQTVSRLTEAERDLIFTITPDFYRCVLQEERRALVEVAQRLDDLDLAEARSVIFAPLIKKADERRIKSAAWVLYEMKALFEDALTALGITQSYPPLPSLLAESRSTREPATVVLVDDFLGSGQTAHTALGEYDDLYSVKGDRLIVATLVAQEAALKYLESGGATVVCSVIRKKGISDSTRIEDKPRALAVMRELSARLGVRRDRRLGHGLAEALVTMTARCPNNTFPVYWWDRAVDGTAWPATFNR